MAVQTHKDFKSVDPEIPNADVIDDNIGLALMYQYMFDRRTTPWEKSCWDDEELENFNIELDGIDRLYYIYHFDDGVSGQNFEMVARMEYKGRKVYVELSAGCDFTGFDCQGHGVIFVSADPNLFMKLIITDEFQKDLIYQSLAEDGIYTEELTEHDKYSRVKWSNPPMLKFLCHDTIYTKRKELAHYQEVGLLPKILKDSVDEFIKVKDAKASYESGE